MSELVFEDPPAHGNAGRGRWGMVAAELREHPGRWARLTLLKPSTAASAASAFRAGRYGPGFEARTHETGTGRDLYLRYVGVEGGAQ